MADSAPIDVLDLRLFTDGSTEDRRLFCDRLCHNFHKTGFLILEGHGINPVAVNDAFDVLPKFFGLPEETRRKYEFPDVKRMIGYTPIGIECGEHARIADLKHFWHVYRGQSPLVHECPEFSLSMVRLDREFRILYQVILAAIADSLRFSPEERRDFTEGDSLMRAIHYPAHDAPQERDEEVARGGNVTGMCASRHTDINVVTLLFAREPGLELWHEGAWMPVLIGNPNQIIVNVGDMLEHRTNGYFRSGEHRVVCRPGVDRCSIPYFGHVPDNASIVPMVDICGPADTARFPYQLAGEFRQARIDAITTG